MAIKMFCFRNWKGKKVVQISPLSYAYIRDVIKNIDSDVCFKNAWVRSKNRVHIYQFPLEKL